MNGQTLREALRSGRRVYGTLTVSNAARWPAALASVGLDFIFIDLEHIAIGRTDLSWMCQTYAALGLAPVVRIPSPDPYEATKALDAGAHGIVAPYVETAEEVRRLRGAVKLRPLKGRRLQRILDGEETISQDLADYLATFNADHVLIINVESVPAVEALDELLDVPDVDAVLIGPHDLSVSMDVPEKYDDPGFDRMVRRIIQRTRSRKIGAGIHYTFGESMNVEQEISWIKEGANLVLHRADIICARLALADEIRTLRRTMGDGAGGKDDENINI